MNNIYFFFFSVSAALFISSKLSKKKKTDDQRPDDFVFWKLKTYGATTLVQTLAYIQMCFEWSSDLTRFNASHVSS